VAAEYKKNIDFPYSCTIFRQVAKPMKTNDGIKENPMSKVMRGFFSLAIVLVFAAPGLCKELTTYLSCNVGVAMAEDGDITINDPTYGNLQGDLEYDPGYFVGLAFGNHVNNMRFEAEIGYQKNKADSLSLNLGGTTYTGDITSDNEIRLSTLLFNLYYDFKNSSRFTPYVSAGLGLGNIKLDGASKSDAVGEYQLGAGVAFQISEKVALDLKGRYLGATEAEFEDVTLDFSTINAIFDVRIYF
jgi:opacity protein-like surface antigen